MSIRKYCPTEPCGKKIRYVRHEAADDQGNRLQESGAAQRQNGCRVREGEWHNGQRVADIARHLQVFERGTRPSRGAGDFPTVGRGTTPPHRGSELLLPRVVLLAVHPRALPIL